MLTWFLVWIMAWRIISLPRLLVVKFSVYFQDQVLQLANYLLSRRHVSKLRSTCQLLVALQTLANNQFHIPVAMSLDKPTAVSSASPKVRLSVFTITCRLLSLSLSLSVRLYRMVTVCCRL